MENYKAKEVKVLDHGYIKYIGHLGTDESIIEAARMSTNKGFISWDPYEICEKCERTWVSTEEQKTDGHVFCPGKPKAYPRGDQGLLEHLYKNKHMTPFEMCELVIEVQAPIFVFREWHRHRTQSYNEFSARYSVMPNLHYIPNIDRVTPKVSSNKQESSLLNYVPNSGIIPKHGSEFNLWTPADIQEVISTQQEDTYNDYEGMLAVGVSKEVARLNTPVSRYSKMRAKANLRNWLGFLMLRKAPDAQWEIRQFADKVGELIQTLWPRTYALFMEYDFNGLRLSATERNLLSMIFDNVPSEALGPSIDKLDAFEEFKKLRKKIDG